MGFFKRRAEVVIRFEQKEHGRDRLPVFSVEVTGDGEVVYRGVRYVGTVGKRTKSVSPSEVQRLAKKIEDAGFFLWADGRGPDWPMQPGAISRVLSLTVGPRRRSIEYGSSQHGDSRFPVGTIHEIAGELRALVQIDEWL